MTEDQIPRTSAPAFNSSSQEMHLVSQHTEKGEKSKQKHCKLVSTKRNLQIRLCHSLVRCKLLGMSAQMKILLFLNDRYSRYRM